MTDCYDMYLWSVGSKRLRPDQEDELIFELNQWRRNYESEIF